MIEFLGHRITKAIPTSVIRLGDGEGMILGKPTPRDKSLWADACSHFGPQITVQQIHSLAQLLTSAIESADVLGIRNDILQVQFPSDYLRLPEDEFLRCFRASFKLRSVESNLNYSGALRLFALHQNLSTQMFQSSTLFTSAWIHFQLSSSGALVEMIQEQKRVGLISSKVELFHTLEKYLSIGVDFYKAPEIYSATPNGSFEVHYPNEFDHIMRTINVDFPGMMFLVGAGVCGKVYCNRIKELGGIALDIGAVCDAWIDVPSRALVFQDMFDHHPNSVPEILLLKHQVTDKSE